MIRSRRAALSLLLLAATVWPPPASGQDVSVKLASIVPAGSIWDRELQRLAADSKQATNGRVTLTVYNGGSQGDEPSVLRKMRLDTLQAASLTVVGLASIDSAFNVFNLPFFFDSHDELNAVVEKLTPLLKKRLEAKGVVLLNWGHGGWLQLFSTKPVATLTDLKALKLYTAAGDDRMTQWYKANGFQPRAMAMTDILTGLSTRMIEGVPTPPVAAMAFQWNRHTPYMLDIGIGPLVGATVVSARTWNRISPADRAKLLELAQAAEKRLQGAVPAQDALAVVLLKQQGLTVTKASGPEWRKEAEALSATMRGQMVPRDVFDMALRERNAFRQRPAPAKPAPAPASAPAIK
jgi:TRAP-type C4-dicarboxylate transport system substrate-binding protein